MGRLGKFSCRNCGNQMKIDVPPNGSAIHFADNLTCTKCGHVGCGLNGMAWFSEFVDKVIY